MTRIRGSCAPPQWSTSSTFYAVDDDFGPFFLKFCSYFPYNAKLCINGHEWAKRQAAKAGIAHTALDNGFATCADPAAVQAICDRLGPEQIDALLRKWLAILPHPFSAADREAGYRYDISVWQAEFSLTQVLDRPISGRVFFEHVIRDNLDAGRPDQISLIFDRTLRRRGPRPTPGRFRTRVITEGLTPSLHIDYNTITRSAAARHAQDPQVTPGRADAPDRQDRTIPETRIRDRSASIPLPGLWTLGFDPTRFQTEPPACYRAPAATRTGLTPASDDELTPKISCTRSPPFCWAHERPRISRRWQCRTLRGSVLRASL